MPRWSTGPVVTPGHRHRRAERTQLLDLGLQAAGRCADPLGLRWGKDNPMKRPSWPILRRTSTDIPYPIWDNAEREGFERWAALGYARLRQSTDAGAQQGKPRALGDVASGGCIGPFHPRGRAKVGSGRDAAR